MSGHTIVIRALPPAFSVTVEPPHEDYPAQVFGDLKTARGHAGGLRLVTGWPKVEIGGRKQ